MSQPPTRANVGTLGPIFVPHPAGQAPRVGTVSRGDGYFLIRVHSAQAAYWGSAWGTFWNPARRVLVTSQVDLYPRTSQSIRGIQVARRIRRKQAVQLGLRSNLIDLVPATLERVSIAFDFVLDRKDRLKALSEAINESVFRGALSLAEPTLATARALGNTAGKVMEAFLEAEERTPILQFLCDFNVGTNDLQAGYYVFLGTKDEKYPLPTQMPKVEIRGHDLLLDDKAITELSFVVLEVICTRARGRSDDAAWDKLLRAAENKASDFANQQKPTRKQRDSALGDCTELIQQARTLLRADPCVLPREAEDLVKSVYRNCEKIFSRLAGATRSANPVAAIAAARRTLQVPESAELDRELTRYDEEVSAAQTILAELEQKNQEAESVCRKVTEAEKDLPEDTTPDDRADAGSAPPPSG
jgi:hypothetical protein